jgi:hypothetical protein
MDNDIVAVLLLLVYDGCADDLVVRFLGKVGK